MGRQSVHSWWHPARWELHGDTWWGHRKFLHFIFRRITSNHRRKKKNLWQNQSRAKNNPDQRNKRMYLSNNNEEDSWHFWAFIVNQDCVKHFIGSHSLKIMRKLRLREFKQLPHSHPGAVFGHQVCLSSEFRLLVTAYIAWGQNTVSVDYYGLIKIGRGWGNKYKSYFSNYFFMKGCFCFLELTSSDSSFTSPVKRYVIIAFVFSVTSPVLVTSTHSIKVYLMNE